MTRTLMIALIAALFVLIYSLLPSPHDEEGPALQIDDDFHSRVIDKPTEVSPMDIYNDLVRPIF